MQYKKFYFIRRFVSISLVLFLVTGDAPLVLSAPVQSSPRSNPQISINSLIKNPERIQFSHESGSLKEIHKGNNDRIIIHIQDAHANLSGQKNLAAITEQMIKQYGLSLVLVEGSASDVTLDKVRSLAPVKDWRILARKLLFDGIISGEEYLNLTTEYPLKLQGVEYKELYDRGLRSYSVLTERRKEVMPYLRSVRLAVATLKEALYPDVLKTYEASKKEDADNNSYLKELIRLAESIDIDIDYYPQVNLLKDLITEEEQIDFSLTNKEQQALFDFLNKKGYTDEVKELANKAAKSGSHIAQFSQVSSLLDLALRAGAPAASFKRLAQYKDYLEGFVAIDFHRLLEEAELLEEEVYFSFVSGDQDLINLRGLDIYSDLLVKACNVKLSSRQYGLLRDVRSKFPAEGWLGFLNRKLAEVERFGDLVPYSAKIKEAIDAVTEFYTLVSDRDKAFLKNSEFHMSEKDVRGAVLISGGYHTENLVRLFKNAGYTIVVLTPSVSSETDHKRYEELLFAGLDKRYETGVKSANAFRQEGGAAITARIEKAGSRLTKEADFPPGFLTAVEELGLQPKNDSLDGARFALASETNPKREARKAYIDMTVGSISRDSDIYQKTEPLVREALEALGLPEGKYDYVITDSEDINAAFYTDGSDVIELNYGLLKFLEESRVPGAPDGLLTEETIKFIIGHEAKHALQEAREKQDRDYRPSDLAKEYDADDGGLEVLDLTGSSPRAGELVLAALRAKQEEYPITWITRFMERATHPPTHRRQVNTRDNIRRRNYWRDLGKESTPLEVDVTSIDRSQRFSFDRDLYSSFTLENLERMQSRIQTVHDLNKWMNLLHLVLNTQVLVTESQSHISEGKSRSGFRRRITERQDAKRVRGVREILTDNRSDRAKDIHLYLIHNAVSVESLFTQEELDELRSEIRQARQDLAGEEGYRDLTDTEILIEIAAQDIYSSRRKIDGSQGEGMNSFTYSNLSPLNHPGMESTIEIIEEETAVRFDVVWQIKQEAYAALNFDAEGVLRARVQSMVPELEGLEESDREQLMEYFFLLGLQNTDAEKDARRTEYEFFESLEWKDPFAVLEIALQHLYRYDNEYFSQITNSFIAYDEKMIISGRERGKKSHHQVVHMFLDKMINNLASTGDENTDRLINLYNRLEAGRSIIPAKVGDESIRYRETLLNIILKRKTSVRDLIDFNRSSSGAPAKEEQFMYAMRGAIKSIDSPAELKSLLEEMLSDPDLKDLVREKLLSNFFERLAELGSQGEESLDYFTALVEEFDLDEGLVAEDSDVPDWVRKDRGNQFMESYYSIISSFESPEEQISRMEAYTARYKEDGPRSSTGLLPAVFQNDQVIEGILGEMGYTERQIFEYMIQRGMEPSIDLMRTFNDSEKVELMEMFEANETAFLQRGFTQEAFDSIISYHAWTLLFIAGEMEEFTTQIDPYEDEDDDSDFIYPISYEEIRPLSSLEGYNSQGEQQQHLNLLRFIRPTTGLGKRFEEISEKFDLSEEALNQNEAILEKLASHMVIDEKERPGTEYSLTSFEHFKANVKQDPFQSASFLPRDQYESQKEEYPDFWSRGAGTEGSDYDVKWKSKFFNHWKKNNPSADFETTLDAIQRYFPDKSRYRNRLILELITKFNGPLFEVNTEILDRVLYPEGQESLLADDAVKDVLAKKIIMHKKNTSQLQLTEYSDIENLVERYFSKESSARTEVLHDLLQDVPIELRKLYEMRQEGHEDLASDVKKGAAHEALEYLADEIENQAPEDKLEVFEWLIGMRSEKPEYIQYLEYKTKSKLDDLPASLKYAGNSERYLLVSTMFIGPDGILNQSEIRQDFLLSVYAFANNDTEFNHLEKAARIEKLKEKYANDILFVVFREVFEGSPELKQLDLADGIFKHFLNNGPDPEARNLLIKQFLISFGVVGVKLGQILSRNNLVDDTDLKDVLEDLSDGVDALDKRYLMSALLFAEDGTLEDEQILEFLDEQFDYIGGILGSASVKQGYNVYKLGPEGDVIKERALKFVRPMAHVEVTENMDILENVVQRLQTVSDGVEQLKDLKNAADMLSGTLLNEIRSAIAREMDMAGEVASQETIGEFLKSVETGDWTIGAPEVDQNLKGTQFFADEFVYGEHPKAAFQAEVGEETYKEIAATFFTAFMEMTLVLGKYHADLHPGNLMIDTGLKHINLIDYGNSADLSEASQNDFIVLISGLDAANRKGVLATLSKMTQSGDVSKAADAVSEITAKNIAADDKLRQIKAALEAEGITFTGEFEVLFKVFETIGYLTDALSPAEKRAITKKVVLKRQTASRKDLLSRTTLSLLSNEVRRAFRRNLSEEGGRLSGVDFSNTDLATELSASDIDLLNEVSQNGGRLSGVAPFRVNNGLVYISQPKARQIDLVESTASIAKAPVNTLLQTNLSDVFMGGRLLTNNASPSLGRADSLPQRALPFGISSERIASEFKRIFRRITLTSAERYEFTFALSPAMAELKNKTPGFDKRLAAVINRLTDSKIAISFTEGIESLEELADVKREVTDGNITRKTISFVNASDVDTAESLGLLDELEEKGLMAGESEVDLIIAILGMVQLQTSSNEDARMGAVNALYGGDLGGSAKKEIRNFRGRINIIRNNLAKLSYRLNIGEAVLGILESEVSA